LEWQTAATWGQEVGRLLIKWWLSRPQQADEIDALLGEADLSEVFATRAERLPCFLVGAHVGPLAGPLQIFRKQGLPFRTFGGAGGDRADSEILIPIQASSYASVRDLVAEVERGTVLGVMGDESVAVASLRVHFLGRQVELPALLPKIIRARRVVAFWCRPLWREGRITIEVERLPFAQEGEPGDAWTRRWLAAYLQRLENAMRDRPENLGLYAGIWGNVNLAVQAQRQAAKALAGRRTPTFTYFGPAAARPHALVLDASTRQADHEACK
jgi:lauroyl/myristoyl acyltransferase